MILASCRSGFHSDCSRQEKFARSCALQYGDADVATVARYHRVVFWCAADLVAGLAFVGAMTVQFSGGARLLEASGCSRRYETGCGTLSYCVATTAFGGFRTSDLRQTPTCKGL